MKRSNHEEIAKFGLSLGLTVLLACGAAAGQAKPAKPAPAKPLPAKPAPVKPVAVPARPIATITPAAKPAPAKPLAPGVKLAPPQPAANANPSIKQAPVRRVAGAPTGNPAGQTAVGTVTPTGSRAQLPSNGVPQSGAAAGTGTATSNAMAGRNTLGAQRAYPVQSGSDQRTAVATQGLGTFLYADWVLTAYGCFRNGTRILCDFDFSKTNGQGMQGTAAWWSDLNLVDDGGKMTARHTAFFVGDDGSQFPNAYISDKPVRMMIEYDNVSQNYNSISLVRGGERLDGVPITPLVPSQPAGVMPARAAAPTGSDGTPAPAAAAAGGNALDKTNAAISTVQDKKNKAKTFMQQMKDTVDNLKSTANPKQ